MGRSYDRRRRHLDGSVQTFPAAAPHHATSFRHSRAQERAAAPVADTMAAASRYRVNFREDETAIGRVRRNDGVRWQ